MKDKIQETQKRLLRYDYIDGTPDLAFGGLCLIMAICYFFLVLFPGLSSSTFSALILLIIFGGGGLLITWLSQRLKDRVTYPRTGYVKPQTHSPKRTTQLLIRIGAPILIVILLAFIFLNRQKVLASGQAPAIYLSPGLMGLLFSGIFTFIGWKIALPRYHLIAAVVFLLSLLFLVTGAEGILGLALLSTGISMILFGAGSVTMYRYLHQNPTLQDTPDGQ